MFSLRAGFPIAPLLALALAACAQDSAREAAPPAAARPAPTEAEIAVAREALAPLKKSLMGALQAALPEGPEKAIEVCRMQVPALVAAVAAAQEGGVEVGRTSHRLRSANNAPAPWVAPLLEKYVGGTGNPEGEALRLADGRVGWVEPIVVQQPCLTCHGSDLSASVTSLLAEHYPDDQATGFAEGDFRGLFWATLPAGT